MNDFDKTVCCVPFLQAPYNQLVFSESITLTDAETQEYFGVGASTGDVFVQKDLILSRRNTDFVVKFCFFIRSFDRTKAHV